MEKGMEKRQMETLKTTWGEYTLNRFPLVKNNPLRAWDAADEYVLRYLAEQGVSNTAAKTKLLLINDTFGALALSLHELAPDCWSDSYLSQLATDYNFQHNDLVSQGRFIPSTATPVTEQPYDVVVIKIPKTMALLEDQLIRVKACITSETRIIATAMTRHIHTSTLKLFEKILGSTRTSLAVKKARLVFAQNEVQKQYSPVYPKTYTLEVSDKALGKNVDMTFINHANVFAKDQLDRGAQLLIQQFSALPPTAETIIDLGCGNGVLGIMAQQYLPTSKLWFVDESYMAIASAKESYAAIYADHYIDSGQTAEFLVSNGLSAYQAAQDTQSDQADLILCNPPFHQQHAIGEHVAWQMFEQSFACLKQGGQLWIVANRHLNHHSKLKRLFGNSRLIVSNKTFVVLMAKKR